MARIAAVRISKTGGPQVMQVQSVDLPDPGAGEIRIAHAAIGLNFIDTYQRSGLYSIPLPSGLGLEGAGAVTAVGPDVEDFKVGDRAAYAMGPLGAYAEAANVAANRAVKVPDDIGDLEAAAILLKGMTAHFLLHDVYPVQKGDTILVHAAAGGVGLILCQWASTIGATVIGTVGSREKAELAARNGCAHTILYNEEDFVARLGELTNGEGVPVVYDSVGRTTLLGSFQCLRPTGLVVSFGQSSGSPEPLDMQTLAAGSYFLTRPSLFHYALTPGALRQRAAALFDQMAKGNVRIHINQTYPLSRIVEAHTDLEARKTTGATVIIPDQS